MIVRVYWNLHRNCWSVLHKRKVIAYSNNLLLQDVRFIVSEPGRQRVIREKRKNVHAFAEGVVLKENLIKPKEFITRVSYNPYKFGWFYISSSEEKIETANYVFCDTKQLFIK